ncbi:MAG TPA: type VI secretion system lipoprotein TssJ [Gammaproteobacteria bacterium]|nr:type VI secretion system lipoprotein TssJ [Gammaproteobacteria bacterium]
MKRRLCPVRLFIVLTLALGLGACGAKLFGPSATRLIYEIESSPELNPNAEGRPSPLVVRFYELSDTEEFERKDFFAIYEHESATLGKYLLAREEMEFQPGDRREFKREAKPQTRYIGAIAAFRDLDHARWRAIVPVRPHKKTRLFINLGRLSVTMSKDD